MKKLLILLAVVSAALVSYSCSEEFNVEAEFTEQYSLNCILRADTNFQFVTLFKSYSAGNNPHEYSDYPAIKGADVKMYVGDEVYIFRDTTSKRSDTERYEEPLYYYYHDNFKPEDDDVVRVVATLPNGKILKSETKIPRSRYLRLSSKGARSFPDGEYIAGELNIDRKYQIIWDKLNGEHYYLLDYYFTYLHKQPDDTFIRDTVEIPLEFRTTTNEDLIIYPKPTRNTWSTFDTFVTNDVFRSISAGDPNKQNYIITGLYADVLVMDEEASKYYAASQLRLDAFSIKVRETNYSNIEGGLGIFGSIHVRKNEFGLLDDYVFDLFGYRVQID